MTSPESRQELAAQVWRAILAFITATATQRTRILADLGLTVSDSRALTSLDATRGRSMRSLAEEWSCDASTATWIVDRLEGRGLAERNLDAADRRLRLARLTPAGVVLRDEMLERMSVPPPELLALEAADLAALRDAVARLWPAPGRPWPASRPGPPSTSGVRQREADREAGSPTRR